MNRNVRHTAESWLAQGRRAVIVAVLESRGSMQRHAGSRMLVSEGQRVGSIGGGHLELQAICEAEEMLATSLSDADSREQHYPRGPALGHRCGGAVTLGFAPLSLQQLASWPEREPLFHLQLYGAGAIGSALARLLATLDCTVEWIDERQELFPSLLWDGATGWPDAIRKTAIGALDLQGPARVAAAPAGSFFVVLTDRRDQDICLAKAILARDDVGYFGLLGSSTKRARLHQCLEQDGVAPERFARMTCPIGVEGISGKRPELIAIAIAAQLLQHSGP